MHDRAFMPMMCLVPDPFSAVQTEHNQENFVQEIERRHQPITYRVVLTRKRYHAPVSPPVDRAELDRIDDITQENGTVMNRANAVIGE